MPLSGAASSHEDQHLPGRGCRPVNGNQDLHGRVVGRVKGGISCELHVLEQHPSARVSPSTSFLELQCLRGT